MATAYIYPTAYINIENGSLQDFADCLYDDNDVSYATTENYVSRYYRTRHFTGFDTSNIPSGSIINSITVEYRTKSDVTVASNCWIVAHPWLDSNTRLAMIESTGTSTSWNTITGTIDTSYFSQLDNIYIGSQEGPTNKGFGRIYISFVRFAIDYSPSFVSVSTTATKLTASATIKPPSVLTSINGEVAVPLINGTASSASPLISATRNIDIIVPSLLGNVIETAPTLITEYNTNSLAPLIDAAANSFSPIIGNELLKIYASARTSAIEWVAFRELWDGEGCIYPERQTSSSLINFSGFDLPQNKEILYAEIAVSTRVINGQFVSSPYTITVTPKDGNTTIEKSFSLTDSYIGDTLTDFTTPVSINTSSDFNVDIGISNLQDPETHLFQIWKLWLNVIYYTPLETNVNISATTMASTANIILPIIETTTNINVIAPPMDAAATLHFPLVSSETNLLINALVASVQADLLSPTASGQQNVETAASLMSGSATLNFPLVDTTQNTDLIVPSLLGNVIETAPTLIIGYDANLLAPIDAAAATYSPLITTEQNILTDTFVSTAQVNIISPTVSVEENILISPPSIDAVATLNFPLVDTTQNTDLIVPSLLGNVIETVPTLITGYGINSLAPPIDAVATTYSPFVNTEQNILIDSFVSTAQADLIIPVVTVEVNILITTPSIDVAAALPSPLVDAERHITIEATLLPSSVIAHSPIIMVGVSDIVEATTMTASATIHSPLVNTERSATVETEAISVSSDIVLPYVETGKGGTIHVFPATTEVHDTSPLVNTERSVIVETEAISVSSDIILPYVKTGEGVTIHVFSATAEVHDTSPIVATSTTTTHSVLSAHTTQSTNDVLAERNPTIISSAAIAQVSESQPIVDATAEVGVPLLTATAEAKTSISVSFGSTIVTTTEATVVHNTQPTVTAQRHTEVSVELSNQSAVIMPPAVAVAAIAIVNSMAIEGKTNNPTIHTVAHTLITSTTETANAVLFSPVLDIWTRATRIILAHLSYKEASCVVSAKEAVATVSTAESKSPISISERDAKIKSTERVSAIEVR